MFLRVFVSDPEAHGSLSSCVVLVTDYLGIGGFRMPSNHPFLKSCL